VLRSAIQTFGYRLQATDGDFGTVRDLLFDDRLWTVRYLVADTGTWLRGRQVLISPAALGQPDWKASRFPVSLTMEQIERSPAVGDDQPVSREFEMALHQHYGWSLYWGESPSATADPAPDRHLRSLRELTGYRIEARDGKIGHIDDAVLDDHVFSLPYVVVDTRQWLAGRKVLVSPTWVREIRWPDHRVAVELTREEIEGSPGYDPSTPLDRAYEQQLHDHYGRHPYWSEPEEAPPTPDAAETLLRPR
jgi:hypothetical protein